MQDTIAILGKEYKIEISDKKFLKARVLKTDSKIVIFPSESAPIRINALLDDWIRNEAKIIIEKRVEQLAKHYGFDFNKVAVRNQSTRWGSCSSQKNLNFNWKLILAPVKVLDYVIIHELAHTVQMNHSKAFWEVVGKCMPEYKFVRKWLRNNGDKLTLS